MSEQSPAPDLKNPGPCIPYLQLKPSQWTVERWHKAIKILISVALTDFLNRHSGDTETLVATIVVNAAGASVDDLQDAAYAVFNLEEAFRFIGGQEGTVPHG